MQMESYEKRREYVNSVRNSFTEPVSSGGSEAAEKQPRSFFRLRFVLALVLFLGFVFIWRTDFSWKSWNADRIVQQIQKNIKMSDLLDALRNLPSPEKW